MLTDKDFDVLCTELEDRFDEVDHQHKHLVNIDFLTAHTGFYITEYPTQTKAAAHEWHRESTNF